MRKSLYKKPAIENNQFLKKRPIFILYKLKNFFPHIFSFLNWDQENSDINISLII